MGVRPREYELLLDRAVDFPSMKFLSALLLACFFASANTTNAAEPSKESEREQQQIAALSRELEGQQAAILENQNKINEKIAAIAEACRQAKIYAGRGR
jgi:uncharacterized protein YlxW (UPF0749 family)